MRRERLELRSCCTATSVRPRAWQPDFEAQLCYVLAV